MKWTVIMFQDECEWNRHFSFQYATLLALRLFNCCVSSVKKYRLGTSKWHDHDIFTLHWQIRLQHFERGNEKKIPDF